MNRLDLVVVLDKKSIEIPPSVRCLAGHRLFRESVPSVSKIVPLLVCAALCKSVRGNSCKSPPMLFALFL